MIFWIKYSLFIILFYYAECENGHDNSQRNLTGLGVCYTTRNSINETFCCQNYERKGNTCEKCTTGYISPKGGNTCIPCSNGLYGIYCSHRCTCSINRCDHIVGCVSDVTGTTFSVTIVANKTTEQEMTIPESTTYSGITKYRGHGDIYTHGHDEKAKDNDSRCWSFNIVYFTSGALTIPILCGCMYFCKICISHRMHQSSLEVNVQTTEEIADRRVHHYEMIDELNLRDASTSSVYINTPNSEILSFPSNVYVNDNGVLNVGEEYLNSDSEINQYNELTTDNQSIHLYQRAIPLETYYVNGTKI